MNFLGSGACTFSLLPLELLHVELKLLTFQDVPDKIMQENNEMMQKQINTENTKIKLSDSPIRSSTLARTRRYAGQQSPTPKLLLNMRVQCTNLHTLLNLSGQMITLLCLLHSSSFCLVLIQICNESCQFDEFQICNRQHTKNIKTKHKILLSQIMDMEMWSCPWICICTTFLFSLRASLLHFSDQDFSHNHNCSPYFSNIGSATHHSIQIFQIKINISRDSILEQTYCTKQENVSERQ